jgi:hypothetical protein
MLKGGHIGGERASPPADRAIAALAARQHGVVTRAQLRALGLTDDAIDKRLARGRLHLLYRGVYAAGHTVLTARGHWLAAVFACGPGAVLSHASAAALWGLRPSAAVIVDVTVPGTGGRRPKRGIRIHRARTLETTTQEAIPVTTPDRTILDLAAALQRRPLERLLDHAQNARITHVAALDALARAHTGHHGAPRLLAALHDHTPGTTLTRSELEERFLALCRANGLPKPHVNHFVEAKERDFVFPVIETDSWTHHRTRRAFEDDRHRDQLLARAGWRTLRFTHRQIADDPAAVAATVRALLAGRAPA